MEGKRRRFTAEEKVGVLKRCLADKVPVSEVCEKEGIQPTQFYNWPKQLFEGAADLFEGQASRKDRKAEAKVQALEAKLRRKDEVLSELMEEHVALKKSWGNLMGNWVPPDTREAVTDFVNRWHERSGPALALFMRRSLEGSNLPRDSRAGLIVRMTGRGSSPPAPALKSHPEILPEALK